ncbi:MAG: S41 family peptidase [Planctomycetota bacterium]
MLRLVLLLALPIFMGDAFAQETQAQAELFAETFDAHWERLEKEYPYFELYGVDWEAEKAFHRPRAIAAKNPTEFAWELARLITALPDPHVAFVPAIDTIVDKWSVPDVQTKRVERRIFVTSWPEEMAPACPDGLAEDPFVYPEILSVCGQPAVGVVEILAAGPLGTEFEVRLRWPDGTEVDHVLTRPDTANLPPESKHYGKEWLIHGRVGKIGYLRIRTFDPDVATLGPDGKMTTMLRAALKELADTDGIILDLQGNGGGLVAASDPFLGHFLQKTQRYKWGNSGGKTRVIRTQSPRYRKPVVALVDAGSASGGEWAARILHEAGRAVVIGGRTSGAEAAVHTSTGPDGSVVHYSAWPMIQPGIVPFQEKGIDVDHFLPLTIEAVQEHGFDVAQEQVLRARYAKALEVLKAPAADLDALLELAATKER